MVDARQGGQLTLAHPTLAHLPAEPQVEDDRAGPPAPGASNSIATATLAGARFVTANPATIPAATGSNWSVSVRFVIRGISTGTTDLAASTGPVADGIAAVAGA